MAEIYACFCEGDEDTTPPEKRCGPCQQREDVEPCDQCDDMGYLIDQTYGNADVPEDWRPVQACDSCFIGKSRTDEDAAMCAANDRDDIDQRVHYAYVPGGYEDEDGDVRAPGDWAIGPLRGRCL